MFTGLRVQGNVLHTNTSGWKTAIKHLYIQYMKYLQLLRCPEARDTCAG